MKPFLCQETVSFIYSAVIRRLVKTKTYKTQPQRNTMNKFCFLLIFAVTQIACSCHKKKSDVSKELKNWNLQGKVKSISEIDYSKTGKYSAYLLFNPDGFIEEQTTFNPDGSLIRKWIYKSGLRNLKETRHCYVRKDSLSEISYYTYNESDKITNEKLLAPDGKLKSNLDFEYDENMVLKEKKFSDDKGKILGLIRYTYDNSSRVIEELHLDSVTHQHWKQKFTYNKEGLNEEIRYLSLNDSLIKRSTYSYLANKLVGVACSYDANNELVSKTTYEYDGYKNMTLRAIDYPLEKTTEKHSFEYKYDQFNNWTFRYEYLNGQLDDIISRKLDYYN